MILHIVVALFAILLLYYWMNMKPKNFPPGKVVSEATRYGMDGPVFEPLYG
jgi:hypothetical protein